MAWISCIANGKPVDGAPIPFRPVQDPHPPFWYAGNADYAGRRNMNVVLGGPADRIVESGHHHKATAAANVSSPDRVNADAVPTTALDGEGEQAMADGLLAAGTPDEVAANLVDVAARAPVDYSIVSLCWGSLDDRQAMASLELLVTEVIPRVQAALR